MLSELEINQLGVLNSLPMKSQSDVSSGGRSLFPSVNVCSTQHPAVSALTLHCGGNRTARNSMHRAEVEEHPRFSNPVFVAVWLYGLAELP